MQPPFDLNLMMKSDRYGPTGLMADAEVARQLKMVAGVSNGRPSESRFLRFIRTLLQVRVAGSTAKSSV